ncbi:Rpp14/Pop5 family protein [Candidatus Bathycorpusculum sp.]|uniref:Rpp14/Pop5 family protein n=1 Tax=Candidatus Bathycorpusculum sp. TaxID=2994959 RepID=UPI0028330853|nr:Rpp14/Pop5 family protein [Candidatus Termitimicrobium sp.]MCL2686359.1 Rpp14/Pop5 family protein [Candidatus Termitimicrobium sp.]
MKRTKRRYLALQLECEGLPSERELMDALWDSVTKLYGEVGASLTGLSLIDFNTTRKVVVIRVLLASLPSVRAGLAAVTSVAGVEASVHVLSVSGTIKALFSNL